MRKARSETAALNAAYFPRAFLSGRFFVFRPERMRRRSRLINESRGDTRAQGEKMKKFKIFAIMLASAALSVMSIFAFAACNDEVFSKGSKMTLVIASNPIAEYTVDLSGKDKDVKVTELMDAEKIPYTLEGTMITGAGGLTQDTSAGVYLYLYTSVEKDKDVTQYMTTIDYKGETLTSSGVGILDMTVEDGCTVYIGTIVYGS